MWTPNSCHFPPLGQTQARLSEVLDHCFWTSHSELRGGMHSGQSVISNTESPMLNVLEMMPWHRPAPDSIYFHQLDYQELLVAGDKLLEDRSATFVLLHMPIPHGPGIYDRRTASFATSNPTYLDNLVLCDRYLAHVRKELEENGTWDSATLVLMDDRSWRISGRPACPRKNSQHRMAANSMIAPPILSNWLTRTPPSGSIPCSPRSALETCSTTCSPAESAHRSSSPVGRNRRIERVVNTEYASDNSPRGNTNGSQSEIFRHHADASYCTQLYL
jgi:hypothetical protein